MTHAFFKSRERLGKVELLRLQFGNDLLESLQVLFEGHGEGQQPRQCRILGYVLDDRSTDPRALASTSPSRRRSTNALSGVKSRAEASVRPVASRATA